MREIWRAVNARWLMMMTQAQGECWVEAARTKWSKHRLHQRGPLSGKPDYMKPNVALAC